MLLWYEFYFLVLKSIFYSFTCIIRKVLFLPLKLIFSRCRAEYPLINLKHLQWKIHLSDWVIPVDIRHICGIRKCGVACLIDVFWKFSACFKKNAKQAVKSFCFVFLLQHIADTVSYCVFHLKMLANSNMLFNIHVHWKKKTLLAVGLYNNSVM